MQQFTDELGITYSAGLPESITAFNDVIAAYLASRKAVMPLLDDLIERDNEMPLAKCFRGYLFKLAADPRFTTPLKQIVRSLNGQKTYLTTRETQHVAALTRWADDDSDGALHLLEGILEDHPTDMLALRIAHYLHFYAGASQDISNSVARSLAKWRRDQPFYGYLLGMQSFGLEESGRYEEAEEIGRQAVEINPCDVWAAHAVTHVFQMQSRFEEGIPFVESLMPKWDETNNFVYHMYWHKALCHIGLNELDQALGIYDDHLERAITDDFYLDVCNAASLLWRLEILGLDVGNRWQPMAEYSSARVTDSELLFSTIHYLMTPAKLGDKQTIDKALSNMSEWASLESTQGHICRTVGVPLAEAIVDIASGETTRGSEKLRRIEDKIVLIGGSHAQRDIFNQLRDFATAKQTLLGS